MISIGNAIGNAFIEVMRMNEQWEKTIRASVVFRYLDNAIKHLQKNGIRVVSRWDRTALREFTEANEDLVVSGSDRQGDFFKLARESSKTMLWERIRGNESMQIIEAFHAARGTLFTESSAPAR